MELVSPCSTAINQGVKSMHPQGTSTSLAQQSHMPQNLTNIHTNPTAAHNYSNQHSFSLTVSSMSQNSDQPPTSNHPIANPAVGQNYNLQKSNNATSLPNNQAHALPQVQPPVQPIANVAPQIAEQPLPEKSHANGTSESEPSQKSFVPSGFSLTSKDKPSVQASSPVQDMEADPLSIQENVPDTSSLPVSAKTENTESVTSKSTPEVPKIKTTKEVFIPKEADSPPSNSTVLVQIENDKSLASSTASSEKEQDPLYQPDSDDLDSPDQDSPLGAKTTNSKQIESKVIGHKNVPPTIEAVKVIPSATEIIKEERPIQKESSDRKISTSAKNTPRKTKNISSQVQDRSPVGTSTSATSSGIGTAKRQRIRTQHYQSPLPEVEFVSKISSSSQRNNDEKLIVFYKNEFLAVRNAEGSFYLCQAVQNIYKTSSKIKIRWLSQDKNDSPEEVYTPDFYDSIEFDCILTNLSLNKADKGKFILPPSEKTRTESILNRSLAVEKGEEISSPSLTEEHPDGLDLSLYRDEDQLKKRKASKRRRKASPASAPKAIPTKKSPKVSKVRKVAPPVKAPPKKVIPKKVAKPVKKSTPPVEAKPVTSLTKTSRAPAKINNKTSTKTSPVVDQKKAKVLARIGKKTATTSPPTSLPPQPPLPTKAAKNNSKNGKAGNKSVGSSNKTVQTKASSNGSVKTTTRNLRKSTRK